MTVIPSLDMATLSIEAYLCPNPLWRPQKKHWKKTSKEVLLSLIRCFIKIDLSDFLCLIKFTYSVILLLMDTQSISKSIAATNCNSLNMSTIGTVNHLLKNLWCWKSKNRYIFLFDIRLCNSNGISNIKELIDSFKINPYGSYDFYYNSKANKRGVGILIKKILYDVLV
jgi:hypothetical protein